MIFRHLRRQTPTAVGVLMVGIATLCLSRAVVQAQAPETVVPASENASRRESVSQEARSAQSSDGTATQAQTDQQATPALLWKGLIEGGLIVRPTRDGGVPKSEFEFQEVQLSVEGRLLPRTHFFIEANFPGPGERFELNDAFVTLGVSKSVQLIVGQLRVPLNRPAVSDRVALFVAEPRAAGPFQRKARDRGVNLVLTPFDGRILYEQAVVNGNGILAGDIGDDDGNLLVEGRLLWFARGKWPVPLPAQTDLQQSPWNTFLKAGWAAGDVRKRVTDALVPEVGERTWNVGHAIIGKGLYSYWQYSQALTDVQWDFDARSFSATSGYVFPLRRLLPLPENAPRILAEAWLEPKFQYERLRFGDVSLPGQSDREIYRVGFNYYPFRSPNIRVMVDDEIVREPTRSHTLLIFFHYMF